MESSALRLSGLPQTKSTPAKTNHLDAAKKRKDAIGYILKKCKDAKETPKGAQLVLDTLHRVQHGVSS
jgi:hypothetical protein